MGRIKSCGRLLAVLAIGATSAAADETFVVDRTAGTGVNGALFRVDPTNGNRTLLSDFGNAGQGPLGSDPQDVAVETNGTVLAIDAGGGTGNNGALFRINPGSGNRTLLSDFGNAAQGPLGEDPRGLVVEASGAVLVIDSDGVNPFNALFRVDPTSGNRTLLSDFSNAAQGPVGDVGRGIAVEASGAVLVTDINAGTNGVLFRIDPITGNRTLLSDFGNPGQGAFGFNPFGIAVEASGTILVVNQDEGTGDNGALFRIDPTTGNRILLSDFGNAGQGTLGFAPLGIAVEASGAVLVTDEEAETGTNGALFRLDPTNGNRTLLSDFGNGGQGALGANPTGVAVGNAAVVPPVVPPNVPNCFGRVPTIVGDDGNNVLAGSPGNDVITGLGGADRIDGKGGNDRICGGNGRDRLSGGSGRDLLDGGAGRDRINGGRGTDRCRRGERESSCER